MMRASIFCFLLSGAGLIQVQAQFPEIPPTVLPAAARNYNDGQDPMRIRLFRTTTTRTQIDLGGWWDFITDAENAGESRHFGLSFPVPETQLWIPGTWNAVPRYWNYVGPAWYRRQFDLPANGSVLVRFGSVFYRSAVWLDGKLLGRHEGGYLPFEFHVRGLNKGTHTLVVRADNTLDDASLPKRDTDWFPYGGIDRVVFAEVVPDVYVSRFHITTVIASPTQAKLKIKVWLRNAGDAVRSVSLDLSVDGHSLISARKQAEPGEFVHELDAVLADPRFWRPSTPALYSARIVIDDGLDDQFTRFGVRNVAVEGSRLLLNGEPLKILGANRHEDHPDWGSASPPNLLRQDVEILKRLGANAVRAHYSLPEMFLDFCDQYGLLFLAEAPAWQYSPVQLSDPRIQEKIMRHFQEMVDRDRNHPSILSWSLGNEWPNPDRSYDVIRSLLARARAIDNTRLITFVTGGPHVWRVQELADVICVNWARYQWYDPFTTLDVSEGEQSAADLAGIHQRYPDKPVILTEFGGSEAEAGWHNWGNVKWSEEFQARNVQDSAVYALEQNWIAGGCVWQFSDSRSAPERVLAGRLHGWNGKGVVDAHRNPKMAFYALQLVFRAHAQRREESRVSSALSW